MSLIGNYGKLSLYTCQRITTSFSKFGCLKTVVFLYTFIDDLQETKIACLALPRRALDCLPSKMLTARPGGMLVWHKYLFYENVTHFGKPYASNCRDLLPLFRFACKYVIATNSLSQKTISSLSYLLHVKMCCVCSNMSLPLLFHLSTAREDTAK